VGVHSVDGDRRRIGGEADQIILRATFNSNFTPPPTQKHTRVSLNQNSPHVPTSINSRLIGALYPLKRHRLSLKTPNQPRTMAPSMKPQTT
jgi:hypothetical protein